MTSISPKRNEQLCLISRRIIAVLKMVDSLSLFPGNLTILRWVSPVHEPSRFLALERSLQSKGKLSMFNSVMQEYLDLCHAEPVPTTHLEKPAKDVFYLPMHAVKKEASTNTKIRAVFDASGESASGVSLNNLLLIGPTVHPPLKMFCSVSGCIALHSPPM